ncbi:hypothetical protein FN976_13855 [Caenimonas sedimenti]|uniref:Uncharacterized protein n=1 Tax=Caenimonas sedimenti TaxID=2596921 RepID=A0A562ZPY9_9BURK|nr:hypothetical protein [Caenimonas sedimenti]TWO70639.1 hypothetical protein FN976_13855 [Caenimonas sedimenti]
MALRKFGRMAAAALCLGATVAAQAAWRPVPGAPDLDIELGSMQAEHSLVAVWVRSWGRHALLPDLATHGARPPRIQRTALRLEFDCSRRTMRVLAANAYATTGAPAFMTSTPGPVLPVTGDDLGWAYDAVCEAARSDRRL